jgi:hypothetical protein
MEGSCSKMLLSILMPLVAMLMLLIVVLTLQFRWAPILSATAELTD